MGKEGNLTNQKEKKKEAVNIQKAVNFPGFNIGYLLLLYNPMTFNRQLFI